MPLKIDPDITIGNILSAATAIVSIGVAFWRMTVRLAKMEFKLNMIWRWYARQHKIDPD